MAPTPDRPDYIFPGPDRNNLAPHLKLTSFDPDRSENSEVWKIFCVEFKDLSFTSSFRLQ